MTDSTIKGKNPTQKDFATWDQLKWYHFIKFVDFHIEVRKKGHGLPKDYYTITDEKLTNLQELRKDTTHPWFEFIDRVDCISMNHTVYLGHFNKFRHLGCDFLAVHPKLITQEIKQIMEARPQMLAKYLKIYFLKQPTTIQPVSKEEQGITVQEVQRDSFTKMVTLHNELVTSMGDINELTMAQKFTALPKLVDAIAKMSNRPTSKNININIKGSAREMEEANLAFLKQQDEE